jgi:hypothetical protein
MRRPPTARRLTNRALIGVVVWRDLNGEDGLRTAASGKPRLGDAFSGVPGDVLDGKIVVGIHWISS